MSVKGLLLLNLGSPDSPSRSDVKKYLDQFLMDKYVIDIPLLPRFLLVRGVITPFRAGKSAHAYRKIWTANGSPLTNFTRQFAQGVKESMPPGYDVRWAMRYGNPSIKSVVKDWKVDELLIVPLYPQYAESSSRTAFEEALKYASDVAPRVRVLKDFFVQREFVDTQAAQIAKEIPDFDPDHVLLSFHGLPEHHLSKIHNEHCRFNGTCCAAVTENNRYCYRAQAFATALALGEKLPFAKDKISVSFQSRLGRRPWIKPYTDLVINELAARGVKRVLVSCPSFVADCLETLEEVEIRLKEQFLGKGGKALKLVPALNAEPEWIDRFCAMIQRVPFEEVRP